MSHPFYQQVVPLSEALFYLFTFLTVHSAFPLWLPLFCRCFCPFLSVEFRIYNSVHLNMHKLHSEDVKSVYKTLHTPRANHELYLLSPCHKKKMIIRQAVEVNIQK